MRVRTLPWLCLLMIGCTVDLAPVAHQTERHLMKAGRIVASIEGDEGEELRFRLNRALEINRLVVDYSGPPESPWPMPRNRLDRATITHEDRLINHTRDEIERAGIWQTMVDKATGGGLGLTGLITGGSVVTGILGIFLRNRAKRGKEEKSALARGAQFAKKALWGLFEAIDAHVPNRKELLGGKLPPDVEIAKHQWEQERLSREWEAAGRRPMPAPQWPTEAMPGVFEDEGSKS